MRAEEPFFGVVTIPFFSLVYSRFEALPTLGDILHEGAIGEYSGYDELLGRRIATWRCEVVDSTQIDWGPSGVCKAKSVMHDYYGLSQRVAATRLSPWRYVDDVYVNVGDEFHESYTYGPVGVTAQTVETEDADPSDNFDHWVLPIGPMGTVMPMGSMEPASLQVQYCGRLPDLFGGTSALLLYDAEPHERVLATEHFDAFGVRVAKGSGWGRVASEKGAGSLNVVQRIAGGDVTVAHDASRYRWRSQEGSETDDLHRNDPDEGVFLSPPTLVYMQTRHYDPALGRFIMADSIPMGAFSPQGLNRYAYCTNDPVNRSDPSGKAISLLLLGVLAFALGMALGFHFGDALSNIVNTLAGILGKGGAPACYLGLGALLNPSRWRDFLVFAPWLVLLSPAAGSGGAASFGALGIGLMAGLLISLFALGFSLGKELRDSLYSDAMTPDRMHQPVPLFTKPRTVWFAFTDESKRLRFATSFGLHSKSRTSCVRLLLSKDCNCVTSDPPACINTGASVIACRIS